MAVLEQVPTPAHIRAAMGVLNYYVDQYGRWIVRKWREGKKNFIEPEASKDEQKGTKMDHSTSANCSHRSRSKRK